jgi:hypothetical protein
MPRIKFTRNADVNEGGPYEAGQIVDVPQASADRWVRRDAAEIVKGEEAKPQKTKTTKTTKGTK